MQFIQVVCINSSLLLIAEYYSIVGMYLSLHIDHWRTLDCFPLGQLWIERLWIFICMFLCKHNFLSLVNNLAGELLGLTMMMMTVFNTLRSCTSLHSDSNVSGFQLLCILMRVWNWQYFYKFSQSNKSVVISYYGFNLHSLLSKDVDRGEVFDI